MLLFLSPLFAEFLTFRSVGPASFLDPQIRLAHSLVGDDFLVGLQTFIAFHRRLT